MKPEVGEILHCKASPPTASPSQMPEGALPRSQWQNKALWKLADPWEGKYKIIQSGLGIL